MSAHLAVEARVAAARRELRGLIGFEARHSLSSDTPRCGPPQRVLLIANAYDVFRAHEAWRDKALWAAQHGRLLVPNRP